MQCVKYWKKSFILSCYFFPPEGSMFLVGCSFGPFMHNWYTWLDKLYIGRTMNTVGKKVLLDQLLGSPILGVWYFVGEWNCLPPPFEHIYLHIWWIRRLTLPAVGFEVCCWHTWTTTLSFAGMSLTEGHTLAEGWAEFKDKFLEFYKASMHVSVCRAQQYICTHAPNLLFTLYCI